MLTTSTQLIISTVKDDILQELAIQSAIVESIFYRWLEADFEILFLIIADEPDVISLEGVLEFEAQVMIELVDFLDVQALAVGRIADECAAGGYLFDVVEIAAFQFNVLLSSTEPNSFTRGLKFLLMLWFRL